MDNKQIVIIGVVIGAILLAGSLLGSVVKSSITLAIPIVVLYLEYNNYMNIKKNIMLTQNEKDSLMKNSKMMLGLTGLWIFILLVINYNKIF